MVCVYISTGQNPPTSSDQAETLPTCVLENFKNIWFLSTNSEGNTLRGTPKQILVVKVRGILNGGFRYAIIIDITIIKQLFKMNHKTLQSNRSYYSPWLYFGLKKLHLLPYLYLCHRAVATYKKTCEDKSLRKCSLPLLFSAQTAHLRRAKTSLRMYFCM